MQKEPRTTRTTRNEELLECPSGEHGGVHSMRFGAALDLTETVSAERQLPTPFVLGCERDG